jgi:hypothetical protein
MRAPQPSFAQLVLVTDLDTGAEVLTSALKVAAASGFGESVEKQYMRDIWKLLADAADQLRPTMAAVSPPLPIAPRTLLLHFTQRSHLRIPTLPARPPS